MNEEKGLPDVICWVICKFLVLVAVVVCAIGIAKVVDNRNKTIDNLPSKNWIEEDLEVYFLSTDVYVLDEPEQDCAEFTVLCYAEGNYYRALYRVKQGYLYQFYWEFVRAMPVKAPET